MNYRLTRISLIALLLLSVVAPLPLSAQSQVAELYSAQGTVEARRLSLQGWQAAEEGAGFAAQEAVRTLSKSRAGILFNEGFLVRLNEDSNLEFKDPSAQQDLSLSQGVAYFFSREPKKFPRVETPVVSAAVRGTEFVVRVKQDETIVSVLDGIVECSNQFGSVQLVKGEEAITQRGQAPVKRIMVRPRDAVQWALYYPAVLNITDILQILDGASAGQRAGFEALNINDLTAARGAFGGADWRDAIGRSVIAAKEGRLSNAFAEIERYKGPKTVGLLQYKAALNLSVGQVEAAREYLSEIDALSGSLTSVQSERARSTTQALRALILLVNNEKEEALKAANEAVSVSDASASAMLVMSYVKQAYFQLDDSRVWLDKTIEAAPGSVLAKARLAELELGYGNIDKAMRITLDALSGAEPDAYALTVLGFAQLSNFEVEAALESFNKAIELDSSSGTAHLGRGLALIRSGKLEEGRVQLETAVHLEPNVSIFRSYLGKAFYEQDREVLSAKELAAAKELDPLDPTPYLYGAFQSLASFRPVEALNDIEDSIDLNDNRAVFRSSFLLDQDLATRGASLSRVFETIGFTQAARIEAIKSINRDYSNYSAHQLLAESNGGSPTLAQASISENILASLLSPVNINFILPSPASAASLNEYTSLFDRPQHRTLLQGVGASGDDVLVGEVIQAGVEDHFGYTVRYNGEYRGGFRNNDDSRSNLFALTTQYQFTPDDKLSLKGSILGQNRGDTAIRFDPYENDPDSGLDTESGSVEIGYHHRFAPGSDFIAISTLGRSTLSSIDPFVTRRPELDITPGMPGDEFPYEIITDEMFRSTQKGFRTNAQYIYDSELLSSVVGTEILQATVEQDERSVGVEDRIGVFPGAIFTTMGDHNEDVQSAFMYHTLHLGEYVDLTGGVDFTHEKLGRSNVTPPYIEGERSRNKWSPKVGVNVYPTPDLTLRASYFELLGVAGLSDLESIQPTLVGGFNQLVDDIPGSRSSAYAFGVDKKWAKSTYIGTEFMHRDIARDLALVDETVVFAEDFSSATLLQEGSLFESFANEDVINSYVYQVLSDRFTATFDHSIVLLEEETFDTHTDTNRARVGLNYFDPSGLFSFVSGTWRHQDLSGFRTLDGLDEFKNQSRDFWILGCGVGMQLPNRHGSVVLAFQNVLDQDFVYEPTGKEIRVLPDFSATLGFSINF
ncbi:MAG: TonB-dependent receptor [Deltaproteobacteria bacterium]|nr:TonB-dependent receptor [Deltaproteobacteria bacterium]